MRQNRSIIAPHQFLIFLVLTFLLQVRFSNMLHAQSDDQLTVLRMVGSPIGNFVRDYFGLTVLNHIEVEFTNAGETEARDVQVLAILPDGTKTPLTGPSSLGRNKRAKYIHDGDIVITSSKPLAAQVTCSNCRK